MDSFISSESFAPFNPLDSGVDELTCTTLLKLLLLEADKSCVTRQRLDTIDRHMAAVRQLIYRQVELVENDHDAKRALSLLETMNDKLPNSSSMNGPRLLRVHRVGRYVAIEDKNLRFHVAVQRRPLTTTSLG
jgi:hypothetical protein